MVSDFFAVGWQSPKKGQFIGQVKNFRKVNVKSGFTDFVELIRFSGSQAESTGDLISKFKEAIQNLENVETNGNNTDVPFFREVRLQSEISRIDKINEQIVSSLPPLKDFSDIRFYILTDESEDCTYRFYIKSLRTMNIKTRCVIFVKKDNINITDTEHNGKALPCEVCYAEVINKNKKIMQYIFNVQDYEDIFGMNETKIQNARSNLEKFICRDDEEGSEYRISKEYSVEIKYGESDKIFEKIKTNRKLANYLAKYNNEANDYDWEHVKEANEMAKEFMQTPFEINEDNKSIILTADSLEAWISVISNSKKLGISKDEIEDSLARKRKNTK